MGYRGGGGEIAINDKDQTDAGRTQGRCKIGGGGVESCAKSEAFQTCRNTSDSAFQSARGGLSEVDIIRTIVCPRKIDLDFGLHY